MRIPNRIRAAQIQFPALGNMRIVHPFGEGDDRPCVGIIVSFWEFHCEFEDGIGVEAATEEDYAVENAEVGLAWENVDSTGGVLF